MPNGAAVALDRKTSCAPTSRSGATAPTGIRDEPKRSVPPGRTPRSDSDVVLRTAAPRRNCVSQDSGPSTARRSPGDAAATSRGIAPLLSVAGSSSHMVPSPTGAIPATPGTRRIASTAATGSCPRIHTTSSRRSRAAAIASTSVFVVGDSTGSGDDGPGAGGAGDDGPVVAAGIGDDAPGETCVPVDDGGVGGTAFSEPEQPVSATTSASGSRRVPIVRARIEEPLSASGHVPGRPVLTGDSGVTYCPRPWTRCSGPSGTPTVVPCWTSWPNVT